MVSVIASGVTLLVFTLVLIGDRHGWWKSRKRARRYAVTLKHNEGSFVALCTRRHWDRWTFEDVRITPTNPGGPVVQAAPGQLYVPYRNILYYQEIVETANVVE